VLEKNSFVANSSPQQVEQTVHFVMESLLLLLLVRMEHHPSNTKGEKTAGLVGEV